ncbi:MAG: EamA family transporter [Actinophytocola sp.]|nr:EamA family transporter [Actinophytocola sp.]
MLILLAALFFGSSGAIGKPAMQAGLSPEQVASARIVIAAVVLLVGVGLFRPSLLRVANHEWRLLVAYGLLGVAGVQLFYFIAASRVPVGVAILLEFTSPVLIAFWVRFVRGTRLPRPMWAGIALAMIGLAMVAQVFDGLRLDTLGLLAGLATAVCSAAYFLLGEHGVTTIHPLGVVTWGMTVGGLAMCVIAPPWTLPVETLTAPAAFGPWHPPVFVLLIAVALISTVFAYLAGLSALRHLPASVASVLGLAEPLVATTLAWVMLGEALMIVQLAGAAVLLAGATMVQLNSPGKPPAGTPAEPLPDNAVPSAVNRRE